MRLPVLFFKPVLCALFATGFYSADAQDTARHYIEQGSGYYQKGYYDSAISSYTMAISLDPNNAFTYASRGSAYAQKKQFDQAIEDYSKAIDLDTNYSFAYANRGYAYSKINKPDLAVFDLTRVIKLDSNATQAHANRGFAYAQKKQFIPAIRDYTKAIRLDTNYAFAYANRGIAYSQLNRPDSALPDLNKAIALDSSSSLVYSYRGYTFSQVRQYDSALLDLTKAIGLDTNYAFAYAKRGAVYSQLKQFDPAILDFTKHISLEPGNPDAFESRSLAWFEKKEVDSAMQDILRSISLSPDTAKYYTTRANFYNLTGKYDSSVLDYKTSIAKDPAYGKAYISIISPLVRLDSFQTATRYFELYSRKKLKSFFDNAKYKVYRDFVTAVTLVSRGNMKLALEKIEVVTSTYDAGIKDEFKRAFLDILFVKAHILEKQGKYDEAKIIYEQSLVLDPLQPNLVKTLAVIEKKQITRSMGDRTAPEIDKLSYVYGKKEDRGFQVVADNTRIEVTGVATDESGIDSVKVNGVRAVVESDGYFIANLILTAAVSSLKITATDKHENTAVRTLLLAERQKEKPVEQIEKRKYYAILIAEKDYLDPNIQDLKTPIKDANQLRDVLVNQYTFEPENIDTLYNKGRMEILEAVLNKTKNLTDNDNLLIFYAGHGDTVMNILEETEGYLIPSDAVKGNDLYYVGSENINKLFKGNNARHILVVLDACFSGALLREMPQSVPDDIMEQNRNKSRKVMTSGNVETVSDSSIFITYFLKSLRENEEPYLSTNDIWKKVKPEVESRTNTTPRYIAFDGVGDRRGQFIFQRRKKTN